MHVVIDDDVDADEDAFNFEQMITKVVEEEMDDLASAAVRAARKRTWKSGLSNGVI